MLNALLDNETGKLMEYRHLMKNSEYHKLYNNYYAKEIGRLAQGMPGQVIVTNTIFFIDKVILPADYWRKVTYRQVFVNCRSEKDNP